MNRIVFIFLIAIVLSACVYNGDIDNSTLERFNEWRNANWGQSINYSTFASPVEPEPEPTPVPIPDYMCSWGDGWHCSFHGSIYWLGYYYNGSWYSCELCIKNKGE